MTELAAVNKSKGLFLPSDPSASSQTGGVMGVIHNPALTRGVTLPASRICLAQWSSCTRDTAGTCSHIHILQLCGRRRWFKPGETLWSATSFQCDWLRLSKLCKAHWVPKSTRVHASTKRHTSRLTQNLLKDSTHGEKGSESFPTGNGK